MAHLSKEEKLGLKVTDIPCFPYICQLLDELDPFYRDYRLLASDYLEMNNFEIDKLEGSPTKTLLTSLNITVGEFLVVIDEMGREDIREIVLEYLSSEN